MVRFHSAVPSQYFRPIFSSPIFGPLTKDASWITRTYVDHRPDGRDAALISIVPSFPSSRLGSALIANTGRRLQERIFQEQYFRHRISLSPYAMKFRRFAASKFRLGSASRKPKETLTTRFADDRKEHQYRRRARRGARTFRRAQPEKPGGPCGGLLGDAGRQYPHGAVLCTVSARHGERRRLPPPRRGRPRISGFSRRIHGRSLWSFASGDPRRDRSGARRRHQSLGP